MKKNILILTLCFLCAFSYAQEMKGYLHKELIAEVDFICEEVIGDSSCAGSTIYLNLIFDEEEVTVKEKEISTCGEELFVTDIGKYHWQLSPEKEITIDYNPEKTKYTRAENLSLHIVDQHIVGTITYWNNRTTEHIFEEKDTGLN